MKKLGVIFAGQGSQCIGMSAKLIARYPKALDFYREASEIVTEPLLQYAKNGPEVKLNQSEITQTITLIHSIASWESLKSKFDSRQCIFLGHSLGLYSALYAANCISFSDYSRGKLLRTFIEKSPDRFQMIGLAFSAESDIDFSEFPCEVSCFNGKCHYLIAVKEKNIAIVHEKLASLPNFIKAVPIPVNIPFHTSYLHEALIEFKNILPENAFQLLKPKIPVISNVTGKYFDTANCIQELLLHLIKPVLWNDSIEFAIKQGMNSILNLGPGRGLASILSREHPEIEEFSHENAFHNS